MNKRRKQIRSIALDAIFLAIILLMTFTPIGFISIPPLSATLIHIPVLIGAYVFGWKKGALYGLFFGLASLFKAYQAPAGVLDPFFQNPIVSVFPRVLFGMIAGFVFQFFRFQKKKTVLHQVILFICSFLLTLVHSVLVLGTLGFVNFAQVNDIATGANYASYWIFMGITLGTSSMFEALFAAIITPTVSYPIARFAALSNIIIKKENEVKDLIQKDEDGIYNVNITLNQDEKEKTVYLHLNKDK